MDGASRAAVGQGRVAVRRLILTLAAGLLGCAQPGFPPGGPPDEEAPRVVRVLPDTNAVNVRRGSIVFNLDEVVSERPQGASSLAGLFLISPSSGEPSVSWRRNTLGVTPRGGLRPGTTYTVTMLPGLTDLDGNADSTGMTIVFSTGATIADGVMQGVVFDWLGDKSAPGALVEAIRLPAGRDSVRHLALADSLGRFVVRHVPDGQYLLRATLDANKNRLVDPREPYDTATVTMDDTLRREMYAFVRDTLGPGIQTITIVDSLTLRVLLDHALDTAQAISPALFGVRRAADSSAVSIAAATSLRAWEQAREDSAKRVDSLRADSGRRADSARADSARRAAPAPRPGAQRPPTPAVRPPARDTAPREPPPRPSRRIPVSEVVLRLGEPLAPSTSYRLRTIGLRSLLGYERSAERAFNTPKPRPADSTRTDTAGAADSARADSVRRDTSAGRGTPRSTPGTAGTAHTPSLREHDGASAAFTARDRVELWDRRRRARGR